jgi:hypothetical protein
VIGTDATADGYLAGTNGETTPSMRSKRTIVAGNEVRMRYRNGGSGGTPTFGGRWLSLTPIRLTG